MASDEHRTTHSIEHGVLQDAGFSKFHIAIHLQFLIRADEIQISAPRKALIVTNSFQPFYIKKGRGCVHPLKSLTPLLSFYCFIITTQMSLTS